MRYAAVAGLALALVGSPGAAQESDPAAVAIAERVMESLGGHDAWKAARYLRFDWAVERDGQTAVRRSHFWDRWRGDYRLEAQTRDGEPYVVSMNLNTREGRAWSGGAALEGAALEEKLTAAFGAWTNDTYWLLMPYKMLDPGVTLSMAGEESEGEHTWDKVALSFDQVGLTPKDRYWVWVNRSTGMVERWDYILKGGDGPPTSWTWEGWRQHGRVMLPTDHEAMEGSGRIYFPVLDVPSSLPEGWLTSPQRLAEQP